MGLGVGRHNLKTFGTLTHPIVVVVVVVVEVLGEEGQGEGVVDQCGGVVVLL